MTNPNSGKYRWVYGFFEPLAYHKRTGMWVNTAPRDVEEWYRRGHSEETAKKLSELGINIVTTNFYKGFGLEAEEEDVESGRQFIAHCHTYGIKALVYVQFRSIMQETIQKEIPHARDWAVRDPDGKMVTWEHGWYWRWIPCPTNGEFIAYLKEAMRKALMEADADGIWLDNFSWVPNGCYCERCQESFRRYLKNKYSPEAFKRRTGLSDIDLIELPPQAQITSRDPISREWMLFKQDYLDEKAREFREFIASVKPGALFAGHAEMMRNRSWLHRGLISRRRNRYFDLNVCEHYDFPGITEKGDLVSMIREYKLGFAENCSVISYAYIPPEERPRYREGGFTAIPTPAEAKLSIAEAVAYGGHAAGGLWLTVPFKGKFAFEDPEIYEGLKAYYDFIMNHQDCYSEIASGANIAVISPSLSLAYTFDETFPCLREIEQALIQGCVPFDIVSVDDTFDETILMYDLLILPNATCLSDGQVAFLERYVRNGGNLVAVGHTSLYDEQYQKRWEYGLSEVFGLSVNQDFRLSGLVNHYGKGQCLYISEEEFLPLQEGIHGSPLIIPLPPQWRYIVERIKRMTPNLPLEVYAPRNVGVELFRQDKKKRLLLHVVNYHVERGLKNIKVELRVPVGKEAKRVMCLSPDRGGEENILFDGSGDCLIFTVPELEVYNLLVADYD